MDPAPTARNLSEGYTYEEGWGSVQDRAVWEHV